MSAPETENGNAGRRPFSGPHVPARFARERTYDVKHIRLRIRIREKKKWVGGTATLTLSPINDGFRKILLDAAELRIRSVRLVGAPRLRSPRRLGFSTFDDRLEIDLHRKYRSGQELRVAVDYETVPRKGLYFVEPERGERRKRVEVWSQGQDEDSKFWFPCYDFPNDKATSEVVVTVNRKFFALSNGELLSVREDRRRGTKTYHWHENHPHPAYLTSLVAGEFVEIAEEWNGLPITYYVNPAERDKVMRSFSRTPDMMEFFSERIGYPYPYEKYAQICVSDFTFGGMENISATTLSSLTLHDERAHPDVPSERLVAHELAHQWWGNLLTCKEWSHGWLNEGFATYFDALYTEHYRGKDEFHWQLLDDREQYFEEDREDYRRPLVERKYTDPLDLFDRHLYEKGGLVLHMLRFQLGDDLFWKALRHYCRKFAYQNVETNDFKTAIEEATGKPMDPFFGQWVYKAGYPEFQVSWEWSEGMVCLRVRQIQKVTDDTPVFRTPVDVEIAGGGRPRRHRVELEEQDQSFYFPCRSRPRMVRFDPEGWILRRLDARKSKEEWMYQLSRSANAMGRIEAADGLARFKGDPEVVRALAVALAGREFHGVKSRAARALGELGTANALEALLESTKEKDSRARREVAKALGRFGSEATAVAALNRFLEKDPSYFVRAEAARGLSRTRARGAYGKLVRALAQRSHREVVASAALEGLAELEDRRAFTHARRLARQGRPRFVRAAAFRALARLASVHPAEASSVRRLLLDALREEGYFVKLAALVALGRLGDAAALPEIRKIAEGDLHARLRKAARESAEKIRRGKDGDGALAGLRRELDGLREENRSLKDRMAELEARLESARR
jgi:aminopeptidase N